VRVFILVNTTAEHILQQYRRYMGGYRKLKDQELCNLHYTQNTLRTIKSDEKLYETFSTDEGNEKFVPNFRRELDVKPAKWISRRSNQKTNKPISSQSVVF